MAASAALFARKGFAHATMRDVAQATNILAGSLYHHFESKDALLLEIMVRFNEDILRDMHAIIDGEDDPMVRLTSLIELGISYVIERPDEARILTNDAHYIRESPTLAPIAELAAKAEELWIAQLRIGVKAGVLRSDLNPRIAYSTILGAIFSTLRWYRPTGRVSAKQLRRHVTEQLLRGITS